MTAPTGAYEVRWAQGWYKTKRHIVNESAVHASDGVPAICSPHTYVYPHGRERRNYPEYSVHAANSAEVMAAPACKLCLRRAVTKADSEAAS